MLRLFLVTIISFLCFYCFAQIENNTNGSQSIAIGFYNLENLFDTLDSEGVRDEEYTPNSKKHWGTARYKLKLKSLAKVIADIGIEDNPNGLAVIGVCEVENKGVLQDLVKMPEIKGRNYQIVHYDSPDKRGIDVALLYQPQLFQLESSESMLLTLPEDTGFYSRDQLLVSGKLMDEFFSFIVGHWPSRRGGELESQHKRVAAAKLSRSLVDSLQLSNSNAKIICMGDFNDDPSNTSLTDYLMANGDLNKLKDTELYNPMASIHQEGLGTLSWRGKWNLFDQLILTQSLLTVGKVTNKLKFLKAAIFSPEYLKQGPGDYEGTPFRNFAGSKWLNGFSDHFPVYLLLSKEIK